MIYGDPVPALSGTITGIKNANNITATYSTTATSASPVGTYPITPALSDNGTGALANYTVTSNNGTLTISPAPLTVTAANASMVFGDPLRLSAARSRESRTATTSRPLTAPRRPRRARLERIPSCLRCQTMLRAPWPTTP